MKPFESLRRFREFSETVAEMRPVSALWGFLYVRRVTATWKPGDSTWTIEAAH